MDGVQPTERASRQLAQRLRSLRTQRWPDLRVTQKQLAEALGRERPLSESLISSWESLKNPVSPPPTYLLGYATFFSTRKSVESQPARLLGDEELTPDELAWRDELHEELLRLRYPEVPISAPPRIPLAASMDAIGGGTWHFADRSPVTIVCARLPTSLQERMPYTVPADPDYVKLYAYADLDALLELFGHIRAVNPSIAVSIRLADALEEDYYTSHLVLLGGVDWNPVTREVSRLLDMPVRQLGRSDEDPYGGHFEVGDGADRQVFTAVLDESGDHAILREDAAYFFRGTNPYNSRRTVTLCNGMFGRGTYGVVRALTDARFRDRNEAYLEERFGGLPSFGILCRVHIAVRGEALTPDWTRERNRLFEWTGGGE